MKNKLTNNKNTLLSSSGEESLAELERLRIEVDKLDEQIVKLLLQRALNSISIGKLKRLLGYSTYTPEREKEIKDKIDSLTKDHPAYKNIQRIYERIIDESRAIQKLEQ